MRLDITLMHGLGLEAAFDDYVGFLEAGFNIALLVFEGAGDIGGLAFEFDVIVQDGRAGLHRILDVDRVGQDLVLDFDQLQRLGRDDLGGRGDGSHRMTVEQRLVARHDVAAHPADVLDAQHHRSLVDRKIDDVLGGHDGFDAREGFGLRGIDLLDAGMGVRAAQHLAPDHAGHGGIGGVGRPTRNLVCTIRPGGALADPLVVGIVVGHGLFLFGRVNGLHSRA